MFPRILMWVRHNGAHRRAPDVRERQTGVAGIVTGLRFVFPVGLVLLVAGYGSFGSAGQHEDAGVLRRNQSALGRCPRHSSRGCLCGGACPGRI